MPEVEIIASPRRESVLEPIGLLEDYWSDFQYFRKEALNSSRNSERFRSARFLRCGLFSFLNYLKGLANRWQSLEVPRIEADSSVSLAERFARLARRHQVTPPPLDDLDFLERLFSRMTDLQPSDDVPLIEAFQVDHIEPTALRVLSWINDFVRGTGLSDYRARTRAARSDAEALTGDYRDFEKLKDDPLAFQDPPGTWEELGPELDPTPDAD